MAVSGTMGINRSTLLAGSGQLELQRGTATWGANWIYNRQGLQGDILVISQTLAGLSTSGSYATDAELASVSGAITTDGSFTRGTFTSGTLEWPTLESGVYTSGTFTGGTFEAPVINSGIVSNAIVAEISGVPFIGRPDTPFNSGIYIIADDTSRVMKIIVHSNGLVSGHLG
jgi:hypothetical protein